MSGNNWARGPCLLTIQTNTTLRRGFNGQTGLYMSFTPVSGNDFAFIVARR